MENASKALLIAGAILICILLIAVAMYIYNSANATVDSAVSQMSQQEKDIYNAKVKPYLGGTVKGSEVKSMIETIVSMNQSNVGQSGKFISVMVFGKDDTTKKNCTPIKTEDDSTNSIVKLTKYADTDATTLFDKCKAANFYDDGENNTTNVSAATVEMNKLKTKVNSAKNYRVTADYEAGAIIRVHIAQLDLKS